MVDSSGEWFPEMIALMDELEERWANDPEFERIHGYKHVPTRERGMKPLPVASIRAASPAARLARMRESFAADHGVLAEDYEHFRTEPTNLTELGRQLDAASRPSRAEHRSAAPSARQSRERS